MNYNYLEKKLSLKDTNNIPGVHTNMDKSIEKDTNLIMRDGTIFKFKECVLGLHYYERVSTDV